MPGFLSSSLLQKSNEDYIEHKDLFLSPLIRKLSYAFLTLIIGAYAVFALRGPQGIPALIEKWDEVRRLEQDNAELQQKIREKRDRLKRLSERQDELELEMRKELNRVKEGEKTLILPEGPEATTPAESKPAQP